ncbi:MAG TPA: deoxyribodipyrimidine photo-lyase, partial [Chitinophagaceae bacterium]|nr:deoxyribodipyrimidine photo-lyase [Chitinophagaceae bacterium]
DRNILDELEDRADRRAEFIHQSLWHLQAQLLKIGATLDTRYGFPDEIWEQLIKEYTIANVYTNHDYEPYARHRDTAIAKMLKANNISFHTYKDQVIFEKDEVIKDDGKPYTIFTPYSKKWKATLNEFYLSSYPVKKYLSNFFDQSPKEIPSLEEMDFKPTRQDFPNKGSNTDIIKHYSEQRDYPAAEGTSRLGVHLRFGTVSIRELAKKAQ